MRLGTVRSKSVSRQRKELSKFLLNIVNIITIITSALKMLYAMNELLCSRSSRFNAMSSLLRNFFFLRFFIYLFVFLF